MPSLVNWKLFDSKGFYTEKIYAQEYLLHGQLFC
jgi:hypothetical protein